MNILVRADSSSFIGTGHIMRDLVLIEQYPNANIVFATQNFPGNISHKIKDKGYAIEILKSNDIEELDALVKKYASDMIVIDHYGIDYNFEKELKVKNPTLKIMVLDDTYEKHYCDILLNHNIYADETKYQGLIPENCELRCGAKFTLLREEFRVEKVKGRQNNINRGKLNVFVAMGGIDHTNINIDILELLREFSNIHMHVITTTANRNLAELKAYVADKSNITLHINTKQIAKLMNKADFTIVTPSVTINEIFYLGVPFIAIKTAENQRFMYEYLKENNFAALEHFDHTQLSQKISEQIDELKVALVNFIDLSQEEKKMILEWRNHERIRRWMFTQDIIELNDHLEYIESLKERKDRLYFLVKCNLKPIGVIDFTKIDLENGHSEFGVYSNPTIKGVGRILMKAILNYAFSVLKIDRLFSEVFEDNYRAIQLYEQYNFSKINSKTINRRNVIVMELKNENR